MDEPIAWDDGNASGSVTTIRDGHTADGRACREFQQKVTIGGKSQDAFGIRAAGCLEEKILELGADKVAAFGGSYLNHQFLISGRTPEYFNAKDTAAKVTGGLALRALLDAVDADTMARFARFARYWDKVANSGRFATQLPALLGAVSALRDALAAKGVEFDGIVKQVFIGFGPNSERQLREAVAAALKGP